MMGSYFGEIGLTVDENEGIKVGSQGGGRSFTMVSAIEYKATFLSPIPGSTEFLQEVFPKCFQSVSKVLAKYHQSVSKVLLYQVLANSLVKRLNVSL